MSFKQKLITLVSNPKILSRYLLWLSSLLLTGKPPHIKMPRGECLFPSRRFNDFHAIATQHPDESEFRLIDSLMSNTESGVFIDVGANVGSMTLLAHSTGRTSNILAFEPNHSYCSTWHSNMFVNKVTNATLIQTAVGDYCGEVCFRTDPAMPLNNKIDKGSVHFSTQVQKVRMLTLDSIFQAMNLKEIALLKIDVEGAEPLVLRGAREYLAAGRIHAILFEFIVEFIEDMEENPYDFIEMLDRYGFQLYAINSNGSLDEIADIKKIVDGRRVTPGMSLRPFHAINLVAQLRVFEH